LRTTVLMALAVTVACLIAAFPVALAIVRTDAQLKGLLIILVVIPLFVGNAVRAAGWMVAFGQKGVVNTVAQWLGLFATQLGRVYPPPAVFTAILSVTRPFVLLPLQSVLEGIDPAPPEAAASLGATPFEVFRLVTLPLAMPGVLAAGTLCFILTM